MRLLVKEILVGPDTLTIHHSIPTAPSDESPPNGPDSTPPRQLGYLLRPRDQHARDNVAVNSVQNGSRALVRAPRLGQATRIQTFRAPLDKRHYARIGSGWQIHPESDSTAQATESPQHEGRMDTRSGFEPICTLPLVLLPIRRRRGSGFRGVAAAY